MDTPWLVRRVSTVDGRTLKHPQLWGRVMASSHTVAIKKYLETIRAVENPSHFDAVPANGRA